MCPIPLWASSRPRLAGLVTHFGDTPLSCVLFFFTQVQCTHGGLGVLLAPRGATVLLRRPAEQQGAAVRRAQHLAARGGGGRAHNGRWRVYSSSSAGAPWRASTQRSSRVNVPRCSRTSVRKLPVSAELSFLDSFYI